METKTPKFDYSDIHWQNNGKIKLCIIVGTRPEIIRLAAVISKCRKYFDVILAHTGQNYDYNLNGIFFRDLKLRRPIYAPLAAYGHFGRADTKAPWEETEANETALLIATLCCLKES